MAGATSMVPDSIAAMGGKDRPVSCTRLVADVRAAGLGLTAGSGSGTAPTCTDRQGGSGAAAVSLEWHARCALLGIPGLHIDAAQLGVNGGGCSAGQLLLCLQRVPAGLLASTAPSTLA